MTHKLLLSAVFKPLLNQRARHKVFHGGRGAGKSRAFSRAMITLCRQVPLRCLCAREIQLSIKDSVKRLLDDEIERQGAQGEFESTQTEIRHKVTGSLILFCGLRSSDADKIKSLEGIDICWIEEAHTVSQDSIDILLPTIRKERSELWWSFNPKLETDPVYDMFVAGDPPPDSIVVQVNYDSNPWFPDVLKKQMEWDRSRDTDKFNHVWKGQPVQHSEAQVFYGKWRIDTVPEPPEEQPLYFGMDFGFSTDPSAILRCWVDEPNKRIYIDRESGGVGIETDDLPKLIDEVMPNRKWPITADSSRPETISRLRNHYGYNMLSSKKGKGSVEDGISFIKSYDIVVDHKCIMTQDELRLYSYKTDKVTKRILPLIEDKHNHCLVEGTLVETERGLVPIERVSCSDRVLTRDGFKRVLWAGQSDSNRDFCAVITEHGRVVMATPDHRVYTGSGFCRVDRLRYMDYVLCKKEVAPCVNQKFLSLMAKSLEGILSQKGCQTENILNQPLLATCTDMYGYTIKERYQKDFKSTTLMETSKTTTLKTLNCLVLVNTEDNTLLSENLIKGKSNTLRESDQRLVNGTKAKKVGSGTHVMESKPLKRGNQLKGFVTNVEGCLMTYQEETALGSVQTPASPHGEETQGLMMNQDCVSFVEKNSWSTNTQKSNLVADRVVAVLPIGIASRVYDITVEGQHEFFADGILVHNCIDSLRYALEDYRRGHIDNTVSAPQEAIANESPVEIGSEKSYGGSEFGGI